jgi:hypothetical protein
MEKFDSNVHGCRPLEGVEDLVKAMMRNSIVWCWGTRGWTIYPEKKALRFRVSGHLHKGFVFLTVNGLDLFDIYITNLKGEIKQSKKDIYLEDMINVIDGMVERK